MHRSFAVALVVSIAGATVSTPVAAAASSSRTSTRLPHTIVPLHYDVSVVPDAAARRFEGRVVATIVVRAPTRRITLHAAGLTFDGVRLAGGSAASRGPAPIAHSLDAASQTVTFTFARSIQPGTHRLTLAYRGEIGNQAEGLFAIDYGTGADARRALFTQLEPLSARRFMPVWDEPAYKATFTLDATIPAIQTAVSNMPVVATELLPGGLRRVRFATSPKMSTYLLFLGIGDFDRVTAREGATEVGIVTRHGAASQGEFALAATASILRDYNDYFAVPYPLPKLDTVASPGGSDYFAAMENWGAIFTFEDSVLLDPSIGTQSDVQSIFGTAAHEIAHQWFGNLVTMQWWSDVWLNEGFATWLARRETELRHPEWSTELAAVRRRSEAMDLDAFRTARPIVRKVVTADQVVQAFDGITYTKGAAVIRMIEGYVGADAWRDGVRRYLQEHAYGNTRSQDLWRAIGAAAGKPIAQVASDFTTQPGVPLLRIAAVRCNDGKTTLDLEQAEFSNDRPAKAPLGWRVPVIARVAGQSPASTLVVDGKATLVVSGCGPVVVNAGQTGYFRTWYPPAQRASLRESFASLEPIDQLGVLDDFFALALAGQLPMSDPLELVARIAVDADPTLWDSIARRLEAIDTLYRGEPVRQARWRSFAVARLAPVLARIGWEERSNEPPPLRVLRVRLVEALGSLGDGATVGEARRRYAARASDPAAFPPPLRKAIVSVVARHADAATWDALRASAQTEASPVLKDRLYRDLANARDETLARRALELAISDEPSATVAAAMVGDVAEEHPDLAFDFALAHAEQMKSRVTESSRSRYYAGLAMHSNDPAMVGKIGRFAAASIPAASRRPAQAAMAQVGFRAEIVRSRLPEIDAWLQARP